jgi:hypothetical protein
MATDTVTPPDAGSSGPEVMASIDADGGDPRLVIADITADGTWLSAAEEAAASLSEWR